MTEQDQNASDQNPQDSHENPQGESAHRTFISEPVIPPEVVEEEGNAAPDDELITKAVASGVCGLASLPTCFCAGVPAIVLGAVAIWLSIWVRQNYRDKSMTEMTSLWTWVGTIAGTVGIILGITALTLYVATGSAALFFL